MKWFKRILLLLSVSIVSYFFGEHVNFILQKTLAQSLASVSSILFGVLGIWVGIMAPESLRMIYSSKEHHQKIEKWDELDFLFRPIFISLGVFAFSTLFIFIGEILKSIPFLLQFTFFFRKVGIAILLCLFLLTSKLLILSMKPGIMMLSKSWRYIKKVEKIDRMMPTMKNPSDQN